MIGLEILVEVEKWLPLIIGIFVLAFDWGVLYAKLKDKPSKEKINEMIQDTLNGYYNSMDKEIQTLKSDFTTKIKDYDSDLTTSTKDIDELRNMLIEVKLNLKSICEQLNIKYISINNGKG